CDDQEGREAGAGEPLRPLAPDVWADDGGGLDAMGISACGPSSAAVRPVKDDPTAERGDSFAGVAVSGGGPAGEPVYSGAGPGEGCGSPCAAVTAAVWRG